jgi:hypothetical protein
MAAYDAAIAYVHELEEQAPADVMLVDDDDSVLRADPSRAEAIAAGDRWSIQSGLDPAIVASNAALTAANQAELAILRARLRHVMARTSYAQNDMVAVQPRRTRAYRRMVSVLQESTTDRGRYFCESSRTR